MRAVRKPILILAFFCLCSLASQIPAAAQGWANGCLNRRPITIDHSKVPNTDQANFAVLISGTYSYLATTANGGNVMNANGYDILFASDANGLNPLPFEQESYDPATGTIVYWVKLPTVSHTADAVFYMFYGNSSISANQSNKTAVWDSSYKGVWHLPNGTSLSANDSTNNGNNGTIRSATATNGAIDGAASLSGSGQYIDVGNLPSLQITGNALTIETWIKTSEANPSQWERIVVKETPGNYDPYSAFILLRYAGTNLVNFGRSTGGAGTGIGVSTASSLTMGAWTHVVGTYDGSQLKIYFNGNLDGQVSATGNIVATSQNVVFGGDTTAGGENFNGSIDEVRISNSARSADWIATEYKNQSSPSTFYTLGSVAQGTMSLSITGLSPSTASPGDSVVIQGTNFGATQGVSTASLNGTSLAAQTWSNTAINVIVPYGASTGYFTVTANGQTAVSPIFTIRPIPTGWSDGDVGPVGLAGSSSFASGTFTVLGGGVGTSGTSDGLHFAYQPLSGDGSIVARVVSAQGGYSPVAVAMIRETLDPGASEVSVGYSSNYIYVFQRDSTGASTSNANYVYLPSGPPYWVKLVRSGNSFSEYASLEGETWTQLGSSQTISMAQNVYVGLAASYGSTSGLATVTFDSVSVSSTAAPAPSITNLSATTASVGTQVLITGSGFGSSQDGGFVTLNYALVTVDSWTNTGIVITIPTGATTGPLLVSVGPGMNDSNSVWLEVTSQPLPTPWLDADIGSVGVVGSATYASGTFTVVGGGQGPYISTDGLHFMYQPLSGDGSIVARIVSVQSNYYPEALAMIRETLDPGASEVSVGFYYNYIYVFQRDSTGASTSNANYVYLPSGLPYWVKLVRSGNTFSEYASLDGVNWTQLGTSQTINMAQNVYVGLATSYGSSTSGSTTATFDSVSVSTSSSPAPLITGVSATTGSVGSQVVISGSGFGASKGSSVVTLNNAPVTINSWGNTSIVITIPTGATSGYLVVSVAPSMNNSNAVHFAVTTQPLPTPWLDQDIGQVGVMGSATYASGTFTVVGGGVGTYGTSDALHYAYQPLSGNGSIVAKILTAQGPNSPAALAMIRETLDPGASEVSVGFNYNYIYVFQRDSTGGSTSNTNYVYLPSGLPYWVELVRNGNTLSEFASPDGVNWTQLGSSQTISMGQNVYVGLAADNGATSGLTTGTFSNVSVVLGTTTPIVTGISPSLGGSGTSVTIVGSNFGTSQGTSTVSFNGTQATSITSWGTSQIVANVPSGATSGLVTVTVGGVQSPSTTSFTVIKPVISSLTPPNAQVGGTITISGSGFGANQASSQVQFNGVSASVQSWSDTSVTASVPSTATSGPVTVVEDGVTSNGVQFTVLQPLTVTNISPSIGPAGTNVAITGTGFGATQSNSVARFYGTTATVTSWSDTQIVAVVPAGAASGSVSVEVGNIWYWGPSFTLTFKAQITDSLGNPSTYISALIGGNWVTASSQGSGCSSCTLRGTISSTYDNQGHALSRTDELGHTTTYTYDSNGNVSSVSAPITSGTYATTSYTYNSFGEVLTTTDPLGNVTTNTYDTHGNLLTVTTPAPNGSTAASVTTFTYDSKGELLTITDPLNNKTTMAYFPTGLIQTITDAQNNVTTYGYDAHGNRTSVIDANNQTTAFAYDAGDRLKTITYPGSTGTTTFTYDNRGRRTSATDQNGKTTTYAYDDADRLLTVTDAATPANVTTYGYDTENNLTSIKDANNNTTSFTYDAFGRVTKTNFPSGYIETYGYDAVGNLTGKTDRKNQLITYTYDQLNRLTQKSYPDSTAVNYTHDNDSRLTQVADPTGTYQFTFDNMGRLTNTTTSYAFLAGRNFATSYSYDAASNRTGFTDPESGATSYVYDTLNRLQTLTPPAAFSGTGNFGFSYDALSRRTQMTRPNGLKSVYAYDNLSRLLSVLHQSGSATLDGASYAVDNAGNRTSKTDQLAGVTSNYTYDPIYELTQVTQATTTTESYTFDAVGNRLSSLGVSPYNVNTSNELTSTPSTTYTYDSNGNTQTKVVGSNTTTYAWDVENRMTSVTLPGSGGTVTFAYDPFSRRIKKVTSTTTSIFAYDGDNLVEETNSSGAAVARYEPTQNIDEPLAMLRSGATSYFHADGLGSITSLSSAAGSIANTYTYDSFGKLTASSGSLVNPFQYTARESDTETGLYYYRARYYDSSAGQFLSEDPLRFFAEVNFYAYVEQNPINLADPLGLLCKCTYSQATGHLKCVDSKTGDVVADGNGYSGNGAGKNNPDLQDVPFVGPIPRGDYGIGGTWNSPNTGPISIVLVYLGGLEPFPANRSKDMMRIHGDSLKHPGNASQGCIVIDPDTRKKISKGCGRGSTLTVGP
jgi:RHS repeat-associated protein